MSKLNLHEIDEILEKYQQEEIVESHVEKMAISDQDIDNISGGANYIYSYGPKGSSRKRIVE